MINIHLLVDENYIEEWMMNLPQDKVKVVEKEFEENKALLADTLKDYQEENENFLSYQKSIIEIKSWLEEKEK